MMPIFAVACVRSSIVRTFFGLSFDLLPVLRISLLARLSETCLASSRMSDMNLIGNYQIAFQVRILLFEQRERQFARFWGRVQYRGPLLNLFFYEY